MNKLSKIIITAASLGTLLLSEVLHAQVSADAPAQQPIRALYDSYDKARYVVQMQVTPETVEQLRPKMSRFWYLLLHADEAGLQRSRTPVVQFGYFKSRAEAKQFIDEFQGLLGELRLVAIDQGEYRQVVQLDLEELADQDAPYYWLSPADDVTRASLQALLTKAKAQFADENYQTALNYYLALSLAPDETVSHWARELVGLTYERLGKPEVAEQVYQQLLADAPEAQGAPRVAQRLRALQTAADDGREALRKSKLVARRDKPHLRGVFGQSYRYLQRGGDGRVDEDVLSIVSTNFDLHGSASLPGHEFEARLNGYVHYDELNDGEVEDLIRRLNVSYTHTDTGLNVTGGRLKDFRTGVYTSFDGLSVQYPVLDKLSVGFNYGKPVLFADVYDDLDRTFFSLQAGYEYSEHWRGSVYYTEQTLFDEEDRKAYGGELRFTGERLSSYLNLDYDYIFAEFNNVLLGATYRFEDGAQATANYGLQRSPFLSATSVLIGQVELDVENYLRLQINRDNLLYDALQRTSMNEFGSLSYSRPLEDDLDLHVDLYQSVISDVPINFGDNTPGSALEHGEYRYSSAGVQLIAAGFLSDNDTATLGLRYSDASASNTHSLHFTERLRFFNSKFLVTPKVAFAYTQRKETDDSQLRLRGSLTLNYRPFRNSDIYLEVGNEVFNDLENEISIESQYLFAGYSLRF